MVQLTRSLRFFWKEVAWKRFYFGLEGYNRYGLYRDDVAEDSWLNKEVQEAVRRLPADQYDQYVYRLIRASQLEINKDYLPEEQRHSYEEDQTKGRYLQPYLKQVYAEKAEKEEWISFLNKD